LTFSQAGLNSRYVLNFIDSWRTLVFSESRAAGVTRIYHSAEDNPGSIESSYELTDEQVTGLVFLTRSLVKPGTIILIGRAADLGVTVQRSRGPSLATLGDSKQNLASLKSP